MGSIAVASIKELSQANKIARHLNDYFIDDILHFFLFFGNQYLRIDVGKPTFFAHGVEVKAKVNKETGEVTLFISQEDLKKLG
ncbi:hypothetical protein OGM84_02745 [Pediococcus acidilactici]